LSSRNLRAWVALAAAAAVALAAAPAFAQTAPPDAPALRGADADPPALRAADALPDLSAAPRPEPPRRNSRRKRGDLPPLQSYRGASRLGLRGGAEPSRESPGPTEAALPRVAPRRVIRREDRPFDPVGLYVGDLKLTPYFEQSAGYASNPFGLSSAAKGSALSTSELGVGLQSNWSRNELTGAAHLGYSKYFQTPAASAPYCAGVVDYRVDASRDLSFDTEGRFSIANQTNAQLGLSGIPSQSLTLVSAYGATVGAVDKFGDLSLGLHGTIDRVQYSGGALATEDYNDYGLKLRASYRLSEALSPFAEVGGDVRQYDQRLDAAGFDRASDGVTGKAGLRVAFSEMLSGEASLGYGVRAYRDARLADVGAPLFDASLLWSVTPLTTITLKTSTQLADAVVAGASADINRAYSLGLDHSLTERIKLGVSGTLASDSYVGINQTSRSYTLGATAEYHLSREIVLKASATHQQFVSATAGGSYKADTALVGVRLQR
jgi:hypothetical protein